MRSRHVLPSGGSKLPFLTRLIHFIKLCMRHKIYMWVPKITNFFSLFQVTFCATENIHCVVCTIGLYCVVISQQLNLYSVVISQQLNLYCVVFSQQLNLYCVVISQQLLCSD